MTILPQETDVIISGGGPVGLTLANLLGQAKVRVMVLEKNNSPFDIPRAITLDDEGCRTIQATALDKQFLSSTVQGKGARYYGEDDRPFAEVGPGPEEFGFPKRTHFFQPKLDEILVDGLNRYQQANIFFGCKLMSFFETETGLKVEVLTHNEKRRDVFCKFLIGADGARSDVRQKLSIKMIGETYPEDWIIVDTKNDPDQEPVSKFYCRRDRPYVSIPAPDEGRRYEYRVQQEDEHQKLLDFDNIRKRLSSIRSIHPEDIIRSTIYTFEAKIAEKWRSGRTLLAGDAAHLTPPFAGQGLNNGLRDAHNLAWKLSLVLRDEASEELLDSYELERREPTRAMIDLAIAMGDIVMPQTEEDIEFRNTLVRWLDRFPVARDYIVSMKFKPHPHYKNGAFLDLNNQKFSGSLVGQMLPQVFFEKVNSRISRLDDFLGNDFAIIIQDERLIEKAIDVGKNLFNKKQLTIIFIGKTNVKMLDFVTHLLPSEDILFKRIWAHRDQIILVRPDRYVAASFSNENQSDILDKLREVLNLKEN
mgnify:CR=1 FL=1